MSSLLEHQSRAGTISLPVEENLNSANVGRVAARNLRLKRYFLMGLLASTWIPIGFFILIAPSASTAGNLATIKAVFLFLGTAHVPATLFFYVDPDFRDIINAHRYRYLYIPVLLTLATGVLFATLGALAQGFLLLLYWSWQAFHYGRQNIGIYAFASIAQTGRAPHSTEKLAIDCGTVLGIAGTFNVLAVAVSPAYLHAPFAFFYRAGTLLFLGLAGFSLVVYFKLLKDTTVFKTLFYFTSVFFFYPVFISIDINIGFLSYAIAHGLQYLLFMTVVSANAEPRHRARAVSYRNLAKLAIFVSIVGFAFWRVGDLRQLEIARESRIYAFVFDFLFGAVLGATMSHFVVDASAWKLRMIPQRSYISQRFSFIFHERSKKE